MAKWKSLDDIFEGGEVEVTINPMGGTPGKEAYGIFFVDENGDSWLVEMFNSKEEAEEALDVMVKEDE